MSSPIDPIRRANQVRRVGRRRAADGAQSPETEDRSVPAIYEPAPTPAIAQPAGVAAVFAAQVLGQDGQKRGLRGGRETLDTARTVYNQTEYSGAADRRAPKGGTAKTDV
ncbi:MAG: hypothetical protein V4514_12775 [Pseudomonadota bacterium]|uniref:hypothetical protein n=1 Tax=unclassified Phenylobacterium TaxID=2640670 RepID=UPI0007004F8C|nr:MULTISPECIES: hypothetical protein [unclassified Phenylobacterium]KRB50632.1 hypothetical protein ASE02_15910 [Phenylobacterium sp. Root700]MBT9472646.1 hypothetical protein [Phenylobacterium sp.]